MQIEIYADILFLINFFMIFFIFNCVNKIHKPKVKLSKIFLSSGLSSFLYCFFVIFIKYSIVINLFCTLLTVMLSILFCFKPNSVKEFFKLLILINLFGIFIGGLAIYIFYLKSSLVQMFNFSLYKFPFKILLLSTILSYILIKYSTKIYKKIVIKKQSFYKIKVYKEQKSVLLNALLDTGNSLKEPISQKSVLVVEFLAIKDILPKELVKIFSENKENDLSEIVTNLKNIDFRLIPFTSIGQENGILIGLKLDRAEINYEDKIVLNNIIIGICNFSLSNDNFYNAILSPEMLAS